MNGLVKKVIAPTVIGLASLLPVSCKKSVEPPPIREPQNIEVNISYSGTAKTMPFETHKVKLYLAEEGAEYYTKIASFDASPGSLSSGRKYTFSKIDPGNYELDVFWDWNNDEGGDSFEPRCDPNPLQIEVKGDKTVSLNVPLFDQTSPGAFGWTEGTISYDGNKTGAHALYVKVTTTDYQKVVEKEVTNWVYGILADLNNQNYSYICPNVPPGGPYYAVSYWDTNNNHQYDSTDPIAWYYGGFMVSPGLPTVGVNIPLSD